MFFGPMCISRRLLRKRLSAMSRGSRAGGSGHLRRGPMQSIAYPRGPWHGRIDAWPGRRAIVAQIAKPIANAIRTVLRHTPSQCASCWERRISRRRLPSDRIIRDSGIECYGMSAAQPLSSTLENRCTLFFECKLRFFSIVCLADNGCLILLIAVSVAQAHVLDYV